jgi:Flp pilus assembly protein TadG
MPRSPTHARPRRGNVALITLVSLTALLMLVALAVGYAGLWEARGALENAADAAALAAAGDLVDDRALLANPSVQVALIQNARADAVAYAASNLVLGEPLVLDPNPTNAPDGDLVFGLVDPARGLAFAAAGDVSEPTNPSVLAVNAVRVVARRTGDRGNPAGLPLGRWLGTSSADVLAAATAFLDRDVIGFRSTAGRPLPVVPLALLSDPTGANPLAWEAQAANGPDALQFDRASRTFAPGSDGLREVQVQLARNGCLLEAGVTTVLDASAQVVAGVPPAQAPDGIVLGPDNTLTAMTFPGCGPAADTPDGALLQAALTQLQASAEVRAWPLYRSTGAGSGTAVLTGFVAARVASVAAPAAGQPITFTLQPAQLATATAVTDAARRGVGGINVVNPYVCKVRLVE